MKEKKRDETGKGKEVGATAVVVVVEVRYEVRSGYIHSHSDVKYCTTTANLVVGSLPCQDMQWIIRLAEAFPSSLRVALHISTEKPFDLSLEATTQTTNWSTNHNHGLTMIIIIIHPSTSP